VVRLAEYLDVPLRERNDLLVAAGHAPQYRETSLDAAELGPVRDSLQLLLTAHEPCPAVVVDRQWNLLLGNRAVQLFTVGVAPHLLEPPANVLRLALHPDGMAARIIGTRPDRDSCLGGWSHQDNPWPAAGTSSSTAVISTCFLEDPMNEARAGSNSSMTTVHQLQDVRRGL